MHRENKENVQSQTVRKPMSKERRSVITNTHVTPEFLVIADISNTRLAPASVPTKRLVDAAAAS